MAPTSRRLWGIAGIDEAGRGPMIGPMVICGILVQPDVVHRLRSIGARDSKVLTPGNRRVIAGKIREIAEDIVFESIEAREIDRLRDRGVTLNEIEIRAFVSIIKRLKPLEVYMDAADVNASRFETTVAERSGLLSSGCKFIAEHRADSKYPVVSAASIVAKVERDRQISELHETYGDFGSGYPSDQKSVDFVRAIVDSGKPLPDIVRRTWGSVRRIVETSSSEQSRLDAF